MEMTLAGVQDHLLQLAFPRRLKELFFWEASLYLSKLCGDYTCFGLLIMAKVTVPSEWLSFVSTGCGQLFVFCGHELNADLRK